MRLFISITVFSFVTDSVWTETMTSQESVNAQKDKVNTQEDLMKHRRPLDSEITAINPLWHSNPIKQLHSQALDRQSDWTGIKDWNHASTLRKPVSVTKIAKTFKHSLFPYFSKSYFEPFERRPKPITLVAFRKDRLRSRKALSPPQMDSMEVAEKQSPYNDVGSFWL